MSSPGALLEAADLRAPARAPKVCGLWCTRKDADMGGPQYGAAWNRLKAKAKKVYPPICHICHEDIDMSIKHGNARWSLDHLDPVAMYGVQCPPIDRVRPAHFGCNSRKKNKVKVMKNSRNWRM